MGLARPYRPGQVFDVVQTRTSTPLIFPLASMIAPGWPRRITLLLRICTSSR
ncbi:MAG: hypothetical protein ACRDRJ_22390 [Streptosporangiaceae bacterium]